MKQIQKNYLGIDVSKSWFDCSLIVIKGQQNSRWLLSVLTTTQTV
ncbi:hypothetical protein [Candidatus Brachybacter algidus]|nr:hypothetical protein [Candidatus Brachybacter algidus]